MITKLSHQGDPVEVLCLRFRPASRNPLWGQFTALLPTRQVHHPLGCHRQRVPDRIVFDKLIQVLVFGCGYRRIAAQTCSAATLRRRRDEWPSSPSS